MHDMRKFLPAVLLCTLAGVAALLAALGDSSITASVLGSPLVISTSQQFAGAISGLTFRGRQFVNRADHGREIQRAISFNEIYECYNPNEAGALDDGAGSTSKSLLISLSRPTSNSLITNNQMAYYIRQPQAGNCGNPGTTPVPTSGMLRSDFKVRKNVTIGYAGISNVIEYLTTFTMSPNPPVPISKAQAQGVVAVLNQDPNHSNSFTDFSAVWTYDLATRNYLQNAELAGEDDTVRVLRDPSSSLAIAFYCPELLQPYDYNSGGYRWHVDAGNAISSLGDIRRAGAQAPSGTLSYRGYFVVGNDAEVQSGLNSLHNVFATLDPEVFNWREYLSLNPTLPYSDQAGAQNHWLNYGIGEGRGGSYQFVPSQYIALNPDIGNAFGWTNYWAAIDHYVQTGRKEGRTTSPHAEAGNQHTVVRSPQAPSNVVIRASGQNADGQLGNGSTTGAVMPVQSSSLPMPPTEIAAGEYTSVAVLANGTVWTWGSNTYGARGDGSVGGKDLSPRPVPGLANIVTPSTKGRHVVAAGLSAVAVIDNAGRVLTWGENWNGQLGDGTTVPHYTPMPVKKPNNSDLTGIVSISIGQSQMAALDVDGHIWTWGWGANGALGNNATADSAYPVAVLERVDSPSVCYPELAPCYRPMGGFSQVVAGGSSFCIALSRSGVVFGWGNNGSGQLGIGTTPYTSLPQAVPLGELIDGIAAGSYHALARGRSRKVYAWGYNGWGQLGNPQAQVNQRWPIEMSSSTGMTGITDVAAGFFFSIMTRATAYDRTIFGAGDNQSGQLGVNDTNSHPLPAQTYF